MKTLKKNDYCGYFTIAFYVAFALIPFIISGGNHIADNFSFLFIKFPTNILLYIFPLILFLFIRRSAISETDKAVFTLSFDLAVFMFIASTINTGRDIVLLTVYAVFLVSVICMNTHEPVPALMLIPGLFLHVLGLQYIFAAYIPVLLLQVFRFATNKDNSKKESVFTLLAYLYIIVLTMILLISGKIRADYIRITHDFSDLSYIIKTAAGFILFMLISAIFIFRVFSRHGNSSILTKTASLLTVIYPSGLLIANCFYNVVSDNLRNVFLFACVIVLCANLQLSISGNEKTHLFITEKMKKNCFFIPVAVLFCMLCFE